MDVSGLPLILTGIAIQAVGLQLLTSFYVLFVASERICVFT